MFAVWRGFFVSVETQCHVDTVVAETPLRSGAPKKCH